MGGLSLAPAEGASRGGRRVAVAATTSGSATTRSATWRVNSETLGTPSTPFRRLERICPGRFAVIANHNTISDASAFGQWGKARPYRRQRHAEVGGARLPRQLENPAAGGAKRFSAGNLAA